MISASGGAAAAKEGEHPKEGNEEDKPRPSEDRVNDRIN